MDYQKIVNDNYNIHIINNKRFHTIEFRVCFTENVTKERITYRNFLVSILTYATKNYDTKEKLIKKCQDLYTINPSAITLRNGNLLSTRFSLSIVNSNYVPRDTLKDNILLLKEIILNPLVDNKSFSSKYFNIVKNELVAETKTIAEEPRLYSNLEVLKLLNDNGNLLSGYSDLEVLNSINGNSLYQSYLEMINNSKIDIFIAGNIHNKKELIKIVTDNFIFKENNINLKPGIIIHNKNTVIKNKEESKDYQQSKLAIGYKLYDLTDYENRYVSFVFNNIFGGGANSLLMRYVREKESLCYYVNSYINRLDNIVIVSSGINKENNNRVQELISDVLKMIINGKFTEKDMKEAKMEALFGLSNIYESNRNMIEYFYGIEMFNSEKLDKRLEKIKAITKEDVMNFAKKLNKDAIFFLKGDV